MIVLAIGIPVCIVISFGLAEWSDRSGRLPFRWAFLFGLTLTPVISLIIILVSNQYNKGRLSHFTGLLLLLTFFACAGAVILIIYRLAHADLDEWFLYLLPVTGLMVLCIYIVNRLRYSSSNDDDEP